MAIDTSELSREQCLQLIKDARASREQCLQLIKDARARLSQLRREDPWAYGVMRTYRGRTQYRSMMPGKGWRQVLATSLQNYYLWLTSSRAEAEEYCEAMERENRTGAIFMVFEILKTDVRTLPCFEHFKGGEVAGV